MSTAQIFRSLTLSAFIAVAIAVPIQSIHAATLSIVPAKTSSTIGDIATVRLTVDSEGVAINNAEGVLRFPPELLRVVSVSKSPSIFSLWVSEPSFSNSQGTISFNGGSPNPGFTGSSGTVFTVTFETEAVGSASLSLTDGAVRANDGLGTDVLRKVFSGTIDIASAPSKPPSKPVETQTPETPNSPISITSSTHPDQTKWYSSVSPILSITGVQGANALEIRVSTSTGGTWGAVTKPYSAVALPELEDGVWLVQVRPKGVTKKNSTASYTLKIDHTPPVIESASFSYDAKSGNLEVSGHATDSLSGVVDYVLTVDDQTTVHISPADLESRVYRLAVQDPGLHSAKLRAIDAASNETMFRSTFVAENGGGMSGWLSPLGVTGPLLVLVGFIILLVSIAALFVALHTYRAIRRLTHRSPNQVERVAMETRHHLIVLRKELIHEIESLKKAKRIKGISAEDKDVLNILLREVVDLEREVVLKIETIEKIP